MKWQIITKEPQSHGTTNAETAFDNLRWCGCELALGWLQAVGVTYQAELDEPLLA